MIIYTLLFVLALSQNPACAYLDPSSGGMLLQILLGGFAGILGVGKIYWENIKSFWRSLFQKSSKN